MSSRYAARGIACGEHVRELRALHSRPCLEFTAR